MLLLGFRGGSSTGVLGLLSRSITSALVSLPLISHHVITSVVLHTDGRLSALLMHLILHEHGLGLHSCLGIVIDEELITSRCLDLLVFLLSC